MAAVPTQKRVCVIGAGPSGICVTRACKDIPGVEVVCYDKQNEVIF